MIPATLNTVPTSIFLHIPKSAGTTLLHLLWQLYPAHRIRHLIGDPHIRTAVAEFRDQPAERKEEIQLLLGHFPFGVHRYLPQQARYFTLLRDPLDRVISYYYFVLRTPAHPRHAEMASGAIDLVTFAREILTHNNQTRMIAGLGIEDPQPCTADTLALAKRHICDHFFLVGLTERFDDTLLLLQRYLGWAHIPAYQRQNVTRARLTTAQLSAAERGAIAATQTFDIDLYQFAAARFQETISRWGWGYYRARASLKINRLANRSRRRPRRR